MKKSKETIIINKIAKPTKKKEKKEKAKISSKLHFITKIEEKEKKSFFKMIKEEQEEIINSNNIKGFFLRVKYFFKSILYFLYENLYYKLLINICSFYALFGNFIRQIFFDKTADLIFDCFFFFCFFIFLIELEVLGVCDKRYLLSFSFFIDLVILITIVSDIYMLDEFIFGSTSFFAKFNILLEIIKNLRILRLLRFFKFYKTLTLKKNESNANFSKKLKNLNTIKLFVLLNFLLFFLPLFSLEIYMNNDSNALKENSLFLLIPFLENPEKKDQHLELLKKRINQNDEKLAVLKIENLIDYETEEFKILRSEEKKEESLKINYKNKEYEVRIGRSFKAKTKIQAILNLIKILIYSSSILFLVYELNKQTTILVLNPLERMIKKINLVVKDPLKALKIEQEEKDEKKKKKSQINKEMNETKKIEKSLDILCKLLIMSFGYAGRSYISKSLINPTKELDDFKQGVKIYAIFGVCKINYLKKFFILNNNLIVFINTIANILHNTVHSFNGKVGINFGSSFLIIWKLNFNQKIPIAKVTEKKNNYNLSEVTEDCKKKADSSLENYSNNTSENIAEKNDYLNLKKKCKIKEENIPLTKDKMFLKILSEDPLNKNIVENSLISFIKVLSKINQKEEKQNLFTENVRNKINNLIIDLGFSLNVGWAIEGILGSKFKVESSYLSQDIIITKILANMTKIYQKKILISESVYFLLKNQVFKNYCRHIDNFFCKNTTFEIYTLDVNFDESFKKPEIRKMIKIKQISNIEVKSDENCKNSILKLESFVSEFLNNAKYSEIFKIYKYKEFRSLFDEGRSLFLQGNWKTSKILITRALEIYACDGPSNFIKNFMESYNYIKPFYLKRY